MANTNNIPEISKSNKFGFFVFSLIFVIMFWSIIVYFYTENRREAMRNELVSVYKSRYSNIMNDHQIFCLSNTITRNIPFYYFTPLIGEDLVRGINPKLIQEFRSGALAERVSQRCIG